MATFNFAEAIKTVQTEVEFLNMALKEGVSSVFDSEDESDTGWLGEGHNAFVEKGIWAGSTHVTMAMHFLSMIRTLWSLSR